MRKVIRKAEVKRKSNETDIFVKLYLEGIGNNKIETGIGFFNHMLQLFAAHGSFDLFVNCRGDLEVDGHHTVEDLGIVLGKAFLQSLEDKKGINRYGTFFMPMDETLSMVSLDISGRPYLHYDVPCMPSVIGDFDTQLVEEFFRAFCVHCGLTLHIKVLYGRNAHHIIESIFKGFARAMKEAVSINSIDNNKVPSTKGIID